MPKGPTRKQAERSGQPSVISLADLDHDAVQPMNFRVPARFHREFKLYAVQHGMSMVELLQQSFQALKAARR